ncbi:MAG: aminodeoxychorismate lyase [Gammaproteobacteria bacterium]|jgi:4-amino-4-deoxychorismate lyase
MADNTLINGKATTEISCLDRGLQYGDGVFETIAVDNGKLLCWDEHIERLNSGCERLNIPLQNSETLKNEALSLINPLIRFDEKGVIKIIITRGQGGRGYAIPEHAEPSRIISLYPFPNYPEDNSNGVAVRICNYRYAHNETLSGIKHMNRLEQVMARSEWNNTDIAEGIVLDKESNVIEGTMSNIFCVINNILLTPKLNLCGVEGVIRNKILKLASTLDINTEIKTVSLDELKNAGEIFICNSVIGLWPVIKLEQQTFSVGKLTKQIKQALLETNSIPS